MEAERVKQKAPICRFIPQLPATARRRPFASQGLGTRSGLPSQGQGPHHLSYHLLPPRIPGSRKTALGAGAWNPTQVLQYGMQASQLAQLLLGQMPAPPFIFSVKVDICLYFISLCVCQIMNVCLLLYSRISLK